MCSDNDIKYFLDFVINDLKMDVPILIKKIRPLWMNEEIRLKYFTEGISNTLVGCYVGSEISTSEEILLVRVYGNNTDKLTDRDQEVRNLQALCFVNCGPKVYARFGNGLCYEFFPGHVANEDTIRDPTISSLIAKEMALIHSLKLPESLVPNNGPCLFRYMRKWLREVCDSYPESIADQACWNNYFFCGKQGILEEINDLESQLADLNCEIVFSHNDTLIKNVIVNGSRDRVHLIDCEYADYNYEPFDIGNHFAEFAGVEKVDHNLYPDKDFQLSWLRHYLRHKAVYRGEYVRPEDVVLNDLDIERLYVQVNKFSLASHLMWVIWSLAQARLSAIDFNFIEYAGGKFEEYKARKNERLSLEMPN